MRATLKRAIVDAALLGLMPASTAGWLVRRLGLAHV